MPAPQTPSAQGPVSTSLGHLLTLSIGAPAAGGTFVARHDGRVVFVRGTAPGETVVARLVDDPVGAKDARFWRAETLEVLEPSVDRVPSVWPEAGTDGVGGAEWAHIALPAQRRLATEVLQELLGRARVRSFPLEEVQVEPAPHDVDGLGSRSRVHFAVDDAGKPGMRGWRSREVRGVGENPLAATAIRDLPLTGLTLPAGTDGMDAVAPSLGRPAVVVHGKALEPVGALARTLGELAERADVALSTARGILPITGDGLVREQVGERVFTVGAAGFWQVHPQAATLLADVVRSDLDAQAGDRIWDLYGGVGLFAGVLGDQLGEDAAARIDSVEGDKRASALAARNLADLPAVHIATADVTAWVKQQRDVDRVVLDPPRAGAGTELMGLLTRKVRTRIVYVSCDPATLARDLAAAESSGWRVRDLRAFDLFPHTHHIETIAVLERSA